MSQETALLASQQISQQASRPEQNATIRASAGTGKTYLLVTRLLRLLLSGAEPSGLLAITFTRKAAAEMQQRLQQRLLEWLQASDAELTQALNDIGVETSRGTLQRARLLFEQLLRNDRQPRITTFHAFCQDILRRFPLEADVPPGFVLLENTGLLMHQAWDGLWYDATLALKQQPDSAAATALQHLLQACGGIDSCRKSLFEFLGHRSDWWAYTSSAKPGHKEDWASEHLRQQLEIKTDADPAQGFFSTQQIEALQDYQNLLLLHDNASNRKMAAHIAAILQAASQTAADYSELLSQASDICYTKSGEPRSIKASEARAKSMGEAGQERFLQLHAELLTALEQAIDGQRCLQTWQLSTAWYRAGQQLLNHFQRLKQEQRLLDFTDLEWRACRLLNDGQHSHWIQYKLDQRINHILVDEFQDTNPTQWRLLLPLLQELAAHGGHGDGAQEPRSVFLVGDEKQSIYRFRRADPRLFETARDWLAEHVTAREYPLAVSWRSSPAIIDIVNRVFGPGEGRARPLPDFPLHDTHRQSLWGQAEMLPLIPYPETAEDEGDEDLSDQVLRNPLLQPRLLTVREQHLEEGRQICRHIQQLIDTDPDINFSDIMILIRQRTHLHDYEQALREAGIPYVGNGKKTLLDTLEIQDMVALLQALVSPGNNLALAQTLRSPLFACSDDDLIQIARQHRLNQQDHQQTASDWMDALLQLAQHQPTPLSEALQRAARWLPHWHQLTLQLPVHDLLDRIYSEGNIEACFCSAFPAHLRPRVQANLIRFIELALEIDSGRYPSLPAFLNQLHRLQQHASDHLSQTSPAGDPSEDPGDDIQNSVRILTIHAAKGLEAPIVFLADSGYKKPTARAWQALIDWPSDAERPASFLLTSRSKELDTWSRTRLEDESRAEQREDANLLYVALTRARQQLIISGCAHNGEQQGWYQQIASACNKLETDNIGHHILSRHGEKTVTAMSHSESQSGNNVPDIPAALSQPIKNTTHKQTDITLSPSQSAINENKDEQPSLNQENNEGRERGISIHRLLELCTATNTKLSTLPLDQVKRQVAYEQQRDIDDEELQVWVAEVHTVINKAELQDVFNPAFYQRALNEAPLTYQHNGRVVHGFIDRLIINENNIILIDYKTRQDANDNNVGELAIQYQAQMQLYAEGIQQLWPDKTIHCKLLFTTCARLINLTDQS